jgi:hypothetical protein
MTQESIMNTDNRGSLSGASGDKVEELGEISMYGWVG